VAVVVEAGAVVAVRHHLAREGMTYLLDEA
jgi:hypothetical protein